MYTYTKKEILIILLSSIILFSLTNIFIYQLPNYDQIFTINIISMYILILGVVIYSISFFNNNFFLRKTSLIMILISYLLIFIEIFYQYYPFQIGSGLILIIISFILFIISFISTSNIFTKYIEGVYIFGLPKKNYLQNKEVVIINNKKDENLLLYINKENKELEKITIEYKDIEKIIEKKKKTDSYMIIKNKNFINLIKKYVFKNYTDNNIYYNIIYKVTIMYKDNNISRKIVIDLPSTPINYLNNINCYQNKKN